MPHEPRVRLRKLLRPVHAGHVSCGRHLPRVLWIPEASDPRPHVHPGGGASLRRSTPATGGCGMSHGQGFGSSGETGGSLLSGSPDDVPHTRTTAPAPVIGGGARGPFTKAFTGRGNAVPFLGRPTDSKSVAPRVAGVSSARRAPVQDGDRPIDRVPQRATARRGWGVVDGAARSSGGPARPREHGRLSHGPDIRRAAGVCTARNRRGFA